MKNQKGKNNSMYSHGHAVRGNSSKEYYSWQDMKKRCYNKNTAKYKRYGARGIKVCDRWLNSYENFIKDMGFKPSPSHTLNRLDNDGPYSPENCEWADIYTQSNNRSNNKLVKFKGETKTLAQWVGNCKSPHYRKLQYLIRSGQNYSDYIEKYIKYKK